MRAFIAVAVCGPRQWSVVRIREVRESAECAPDLGPQGAHRDRGETPYPNRFVCVCTHMYLYGDTNIAIYVRGVLLNGVYVCICKCKYVCMYVSGQGGPSGREEREGIQCENLPIFLLSFFPTLTLLFNCNVRETLTQMRTKVGSYVCM